MSSSETFLYLTTRGRQSGLPRTIEVWFVEREGCAYVVAETRERAGWVKNLSAHPEVSFSIGERADRQRVSPQRAAHARALDPQREPQLVSEVRALMDAKYGWSDGLVVELAPD